MSLRTLQLRDPYTGKITQLRKGDMLRWHQRELTVLRVSLEDGDLHNLVFEVKKGHLKPGWSMPHMHSNQFGDILLLIAASHGLKLLPCQSAFRGKMINVYALVDPSFDPLSPDLPALQS